MQGIEIWKECEPHYWVSHTGKVMNTHTKRILKPTINPVNGYTQIRFRERTRSVHSLVMRTFVGPRPAGYETNHKDGNKQNNNFLFNLEYTTSSGNRLHAYNVLKIAPNKANGVINRMAKLSVDQVREMRTMGDAAMALSERYERGIAIAKIAKKFKMTLSPVYKIIRRAAYKNVV